MANNGRKPAEEDGSAMAERGSVEAENGGEVGAMQTDNGNSAQYAVVEPEIDQRIQNHLGRKLKDAYEDLVRQPVPDKFHQLLDELERKEKKQ